jgi:hypothetical protein
MLGVSPQAVHKTLVIAITKVERHPDYTPIIRAKDILDVLQESRLAPGNGHRRDPGERPVSLDEGAPLQAPRRRVMAG